MRQFFSWRLWAALAALAGLAVLLKIVLPADASTPPRDPGPPERHVDFVSLVYSIQASPDFAIRDGYVNGTVDFVLDGQRTMHVLPGTLADVSCQEIGPDNIGRCVVLADLLGDAVIWFALVPVATGFRAELPPIAELLEDNIARLENGWLIHMASAVDRLCDAETSSLQDLIDRFGPQSTTIVDLSTQKIVLVKCSPDVVDPDSTEPPSTPPTTAPAPTTTVTAPPGTDAGTTTTSTDGGTTTTVLVPNEG